MDVLNLDIHSFCHLDVFDNQYICLINRNCKAYTDWLFLDSLIYFSKQSIDSVIKVSSFGEV